MFIVAQVMSFGERLGIIARSELGSDLDCSVINYRSVLGSDLDCYELTLPSPISHLSVSHLCAIRIIFLHMVSNQVAVV